MITEKEMDELKDLVDAVFINCNIPESENKKDVLDCMLHVFNSLVPVQK